MAKGNNSRPAKKSNWCSPLFAMCSNTSKNLHDLADTNDDGNVNLLDVGVDTQAIGNAAFNAADVNKDGKINFQDVTTALDKVADALGIEEGNLKERLASFASKTSKLADYLTAVQVIFKNDPIVVTAITLAITALNAISLGAQAVTDIGGQIAEYSKPKNLNDVGANINDIEKTLLSVESYTRTFGTVLNVGVDDTSFKNMHKALNIIKKKYNQVKEASELFSDANAFETNSKRIEEEIAAREANRATLTIT